ncbi:hypothetical protein NDU88_005209 [Pleurodeles waltl]|uniref:Uncharacterized protein n=1 Tax=Pleurodeles waltl TaxID=8319 RepID=A0AAV7WXL6_PLEWA|nr:hypothetical protein NDU88_005209 [Pleurodeles waltl]
MPDHRGRAGTPVGLGEESERGERRIGLRGLRPRSGEAALDLARRYKQESPRGTAAPGTVLESHRSLAPAC